MSSNHLVVTDGSGDDARVLRLSGELDAHTAEVLLARLDDAELHDGALVVDLSDVTFLDSAGIGALVEGHRRWGEAGHQFALAGVPDRVRSVLGYAGLGDHFEIEP